MMNTKDRSDIMQLVYIALCSAMICLLTMAVRIPTYIGYTHLGDSMIFVSAIILGKKGGAIASAIGMSLADILGGYIVWAPFTFIIKGIMGYIAGSIAYRYGYKGEDFKNNIIACVVSGIWMVAGYYFANVIITRFVYVKTANIYESIKVAALGIPSNIVEVLVGALVAFYLIKALRGYREKSNRY